MSDLSKKVSKGLIWTYLERIAAQLVTLIITVVLARLIDPAEYGIIAIVTIFITIADSFVTSGFGNALIQKKDADELDFSTTFYFSILFSFGIYLILFFCSPLIAEFYDMPSLIPVIRVMGLRLPIAAINSVQQAYVSKKMEFRKFFFSTIGGTVVSAAAGIICALCGMGVWALVVQYLSNVAISTIVLWFTAGWTPKLLYSQKRMNKMLSFGWKIMFVGVATSVYSNLRNLAIGKKFDEVELSFSTKGEQFPHTIAGNINSSISKVLYPVLAENQNDIGTIKSIMRRSITVGNYVLAPILFGLAVVAEPFVLVLLGDKWADCIPFMQIMCVVYALQPMQTSSMQAMKALGKGTVYLVSDIIKKVIGIIILLITIFCFKSVFAIIMGALVTEIFAAIINIPINKKLVNYTYKEQFLDLLRPALLTGAMCLSAYLVSLISMPMILMLIMQIITGMVVYVAASIFSRDKTFSYILGLAKKMIKGR